MALEQIVVEKYGPRNKWRSLKKKIGLMRDGLMKDDEKAMASGTQWSRKGGFLKRTA